MAKVALQALGKIVPEHADKGYVYYYRGQYGFNYPPCPSSLRKTTTISENSILNKLVAAMPNDYANISDVERLSRMEHFGIPSRLLNITSNPLVALFFCCDNLEEYNTSESYSLTHPKYSYIFRYRLAQSKEGKMSYPALPTNVGRGNWFVQKRIKCFDQGSYTLYPFSSDSGILLSALPSLTPFKQSELRCDALMDYLGQCFAQHISNAYNNRNGKHCTYEEQQAIKLQLRYLFRGFQKLVERWVSNQHEKLTGGRMTEDLRRELERKLSNNYLTRYFRIWCPLKFSITQVTGQPALWLDVFGYRFVGERDSQGHGIFYPTTLSPASNYTPIPSAGQNADKDRAKYDLIQLLAAEEEKMLINPETGHYDSGPMCEMHDHISNQHPGFSMKAQPSTLLDGIFISPALTFERIVAQQGAFQLYGLSSFWNIRRTIVFLWDNRKLIPFRKSGSWWETVVHALSEDDMKLLGSTDGNVAISRTSLIWKYVKYVHRCAIVPLNQKSRSKYCYQLRNDLKLLGVDRGTLGRDLRNTYASMK